LKRERQSPEFKGQQASAALGIGKRFTQIKDATLDADQKIYAVQQAIKEQEAERTKSFDAIIADLNLELALKPLQPNKRVSSCGWKRKLQRFAVISRLQTRRKTKLKGASVN
jgi:hypothetical protein